MTMAPPNFRHDVGSWTSFFDTRQTAQSGFRCCPQTGQMHLSVAWALKPRSPRSPHTAQSEHVGWLPLQSPTMLTGSPVRALVPLTVTPKVNNDGGKR
jgi:hypothetical protein